MLIGPWCSWKSKGNAISDSAFDLEEFRDLKTKDTVYCHARRHSDPRTMYGPVQNRTTALCGHANKTRPPPSQSNFLKTLDSPNTSAFPYAAHTTALKIATSKKFRKNLHKPVVRLFMSSSRKRKLVVKCHVGNFFI